MTKFVTTFVLSLAVSFIHAQPVGYAYVRQITTQHQEVMGTSNLIDFPLLVSFSSPELRTTAHGGHVQNVNGYDILFTLGDCSTILNHQVETYNGVTGELVVWVQIPTLLATSDQDIFMYYGNSAVISDPSTSNVWTSAYSSVWHMNQSPSNSPPQLIDYSSHANNGSSNGGMTTGNLIDAKIGSGLDFDGVDDYIDCGQDISLNASTNLTVSAWIYPRAINGHVINMGGGWDDPGFSMFQLGGTFRVELQNATEKETVFNSSSLNQWVYWVFTYDYNTGNVASYINGVLQPNIGHFVGPIGDGVEALNIGRKEQDGFYFNGLIDEARVIFETKNADWVQTEYNNQNNPDSFYSISAELPASVPCTPLPSQLVNFDVTSFGNHSVEINWETASEENSDYFEVQRSEDGEHWEFVEKMSASGGSTSLLEYKVIDQLPYSGTSYYRLRLVDVDGNTSFSNLRSVYLSNKGQNGLMVYPNPAQDEITVLGFKQTSDQFQLLDLLGKRVSIDFSTALEDALIVNISSLKPGVYFLQVGTESIRFVKQ